VVKQDRREGLLQVPAEVAGHPQQHVGAHPVGQPMPDGPHLDFTVPRRMAGTHERIVREQHTFTLIPVLGTRYWDVSTTIRAASLPWGRTRLPPARNPIDNKLTRLSQVPNTRER
jgi:hypothetical protein